MYETTQDFSVFNDLRPRTQASKRMNNTIDNTSAYGGLMNSSKMSATLEERLISEYDQVSKMHRLPQAS